MGSPTFGELEVRLEPPVEVSGWLSSPVADQPVKQCSRARAEQCELWEVGGIAHACRGGAADRARNSMAGRNPPQAPT